VSAVAKADNQLKEQEQTMPNSGPNHSPAREGARRAAYRGEGFTLIELLLVLVILAVLAAIVVPKFTGRSEQARVAAAKADIAAIELQLDTFEVDAGRYPTTEEGLAALVTPPASIKAWNGPYLKRGVPVDPWQHPYNYRYPGQYNANGVDLWSFGPDGNDGGGDDITNWNQNQQTR
jgi:general secretion pathway protein G